MESLSTTHRAELMEELLLNGSRTACPQCAAIFAPKRSWQRFCSLKCRTEYHQAHGHQATVKRVSKIKGGKWSLTLHCDDGEWAELGALVQVVRK